MVQLKQFRNNRFGKKGFWRKTAAMSLTLALSAPFLPGTFHNPGSHGKRHGYG